MGMPEMPGVINEMEKKMDEKEPFVIKAGFNMYTSTASLRAMEPPTDEEMYRRLSSRRLEF